MSSHTLIIGAGVFGLSTAHALLSRHPDIRITILDAAPILPNPSGSSVDSSRIVRADYAQPAYARLALEAQQLWRDKSAEGWGGEGRYHEPGFLLTADEGRDGYLRQSLENVQELARKGGFEGKIEVLRDKESIKKASGYLGASGDSGYVNWSSGWADAELCVAYMLKKLKKVSGGRLVVRSGCRVRRLLLDDTRRCTGAELENGETVEADLTVLAAGAWSGTLVDLTGRAVATGHPLAYIEISEDEQKMMGMRPTIMNMSRGMFIIPPRNRELKIARHGYGYRNLKKIDLSGRTSHKGAENGGASQGEIIEVSVPEVGIPIPVEAENVCREALREVVPEMADRKFARTRICWYCDTHDGNWLIDHHPDHPGLFIATGGSGHGFKFFPVIGDKIVDVLERQSSMEYAELWQWKERVEGLAYTEDGSRSGPKNLMLDEEVARVRI